MPTETQATLPESASLAYRDARSDKVYNLELTQCETGWTVTAQYGRRGSTLVADVKIERASYEAAKKIYDATLRSKLAKGYQSVEVAAVKHATRFDDVVVLYAPEQPDPGATLSPLEMAKELSSVLSHHASQQPVGPALTRARNPISKEVKFQPELLTRIETTEAKAYAQNPRYGFQQKRDGVRLTVCVENGNAFGYNKLGWVVPLDPQLYKLVLRFCAANLIKDLLLDGEWEATGYWAWDILQFGPIDARQSSYRDRHRSLVAAFGGAEASLIHVVPVVWTTVEKMALWNQLQEIRAEGFAVKDGNAVYRGGRNGQHFKYKFESTHSFIVGPKPKADDHRSVAVYVFDAGRKRYMGSVKVAGCYEVPADGAVIDVRYLYCFQGREGRIYQPCFFGVVRTDVRPEDCVVQQLKMKQDEEAA